ncbi:MAG: glycoside hydrolase family 26 protein [Alphaproteobacteria bacterium]
MTAAAGPLRPAALVNRLEGVRLALGRRFTVEDRLAGIRTRLDDDRTTVDVFVQPVGERVGFGVENYLHYGNLRIEEGAGGVDVFHRGKRRVRWRRVVETSWTRPALRGVAGDRNVYREANVVLDDRVVTLIARSEPSGRLAESLLWELADSVEPIRSDARAGADEMVIDASDVPVPMPEGPAATREIVHRGGGLELRIPPGRLVWGAYTPWVPFGKQWTEPLLDVERIVGHRFELLMEYQRCDAHAADVADALVRTRDDGRLLLLSFQPFMPGSDEILVPAFIEGRFDDQVREYGRLLRDVGAPVFVRFANEMNGDWVRWCAWWLSKDADLWVTAWKRFRRLLLEEGAHNCIFVWNPHDRSMPNFKWNSAHVYWPGDEEVDWVGLTGYNNGIGTPGGVWRELDEIYRPVYDDYRARYPTKPFVITEFASHEDGGRKDEWIRRGLPSLARNYPQIRAAVWWNAIDDTWLYEIGSSESAREAFAEAMRDPLLARSTVRRLAVGEEKP